MTDQTDQSDVDDGTDPRDRMPAVSDDSALAELIAHAKALTVDDPSDVHERIVRSMLRSTSITDLLNAGAATPAEQIYNMPLTFTGIRASESDFQDGPDLYLHVEAVIKSNGDQVTVSCGARDVVTKLLLADLRGWFPFDGIIQRSQKATKDGFYPVFLRAIDANNTPL